MNDKDMIINNLRHLINNMNFTSNPEYWVGQANKMLDDYYKNGGKFIKSNSFEYLTEHYE